jgi:hypothetical protein
MEAKTDADYDRIADLLAATELSASPAEAHGILCGLICGGDPNPKETWLAQLFADTSTGAQSVDLIATESRRDLEEVAERAIEEIEGPGLGLSMLLPPDEHPLAERATGVYDWVRGFLFALGLQGIAESDLSDHTREIFSDFTDLTRMDLNDMEDDEENADALTEISEYIWVAAMLVYEERVTGPAERKARPARGKA